MKKILICLLALTLALPALLTACGGQQAGGNGDSVAAGTAAGQQQSDGTEAADPTSGDSATTGAAAQADARAMRFEVTDAAKEELQLMIDEDEKGAEKVFLIEPVRC